MGTKGEQKLVSLETRDGNVFWNHCGYEVHSNQVCQTGVHTNSSWVFNAGGVQEFTINPTLGGDLLLPLASSVGGVPQFTRMRRVSNPLFRPCDFSNAALMLKCDTGDSSYPCYECTTPCSDKNSKFRLQTHIDGLENVTVPYCLTVGSVKDPNDLHFTPCSSTSAQTLESRMQQLFQFALLDMDNAQARIQSAYTMSCLYVRKLNDASHLALDTTCLLPSNFHF